MARIVATLIVNHAKSQGYPRPQKNLIFASTLFSMLAVSRDMTATSKARRTDSHRPGAIEPENYTYILSYNLPASFGGAHVPRINTERVFELQNAARDAGHEIFGGCGKCGVCGAAYIYGDLYRHQMTQALVHMGHDCADKYELIADRRFYERELDAAKVRSAKEHEVALKEERFQSFCAKHSGLADAFQAQHPVVQDIASKLRKYGTISPKQIELVLKLAQSQAVELHVAAPTGKTTFEGTIVSVKVKNSYWNARSSGHESYGMTVKVETSEGSWLAWGTCPAAISSTETLVGRRVKVTAALKAGRDPHFAIMSRPKVELIEG